MAEKRNAYMAFYDDLRALAAERLPWVRHLDLWQNQVSYAEEGEEEIVLPALFVEFGRVEWMQQGMGTLSGDCAVRIHILSHSLQGSAFAGEGTDALEFLQMCDELNDNVVQMFSPYYTSPMHTATEHDTNATSVRHTVEEYAVRLAEGREVETAHISAVRPGRPVFKV